MRRSTRTAVLLVLVLGCVVAVAAAQSVEVRGVVTDETGGLIAGAMVTLTDARAARTTTTTSPEGRYQMVTRSRGRMTLTVQATGFAPSTRTVTLNGDGSVTYDPTGSTISTRTTHQTYKPC